MIKQPICSDFKPSTNPRTRGRPYAMSRDEAIAFHRNDAAASRSRLASAISTKHAALSRLRASRTSWNPFHLRRAIREAIAILETAP